MKKIIKTLLVVMVLAVVLTAFTGCDAVETLKGIIPSELAAMIPPQLTCSVLGHKGAEHTPCERCGEVWMESNGSLECVLNGHKMVSVTQILPTCTEDGMTSGLVCSVCGHEDAPRKVLPATGHKMIPATCEVAEYCIYCRITGAEALGHTPVDVPAVDPTCSSVGYTAGQVCGVCDEVLNGFEEIAIDPTAHKVVDVEALAPTCSTPGHTAGTACELCDEILSGCEEIAIDPDAHVYTTGVCMYCYAPEYVPGEYTLVVDAALQAAAYKLTMVYVPEAGHYHFTTNLFDASAYVQLWIFTTEYTSSSTEDWPSDLQSGAWLEYSATGHAYLEPGYYLFGIYGLNIVPADTYSLTIKKVDCTNTEEVTKAPTCTETGLKTTTCTVCGHVVEGVEVPATGHTNGTPVEENRVEATCSANGSYDSVVYCTVCETEVSREANVIPAAGHKDANGDFKCDGCSKTMLPADGTALTIKEALTIAELAGTSYTTQKYYITGIIKNVYNTQYGNMYIVDEAGNELCIYGLYSADGKTRYDAMSYKPMAGDEVTVYTVLGTYGTTCQGKNAWLDEVVHNHNYSEATCTEPATCGCGDTTGSALGHSFSEGACSTCGAVDPDYEGEVSTPTYVKVTSADQLTSGTYVLVVNGYVVTNYNNGWVEVVKFTGSGDTIVSEDISTWTLTVNGSSVTLKDSKGQFIKPKSGNNNGIQTGSYNWAWTIKDGKVNFKGTGSDTTILAANVQSSNKIRAYKTSTASGNPSGYPTNFTLYKLVEN